MTNKKVIRLQNIQDMDSSKIEPKVLLDFLQEELDELDPEQMVVIIPDKKVGYRYYISKMKDEEIIHAFEAIKMLLLATRFGE